MILFRSLLACALLACGTAYAADCVKPADDGKYFYFMGTGYGRTEGAAHEKADSDARNQVRQLLGFTLTSRSYSYQTMDEDESVYFSEEQVKLDDNASVKGLFKVCENPVQCRKKECSAKILYRYPRKEYEKEKKRLEENESVSRKKDRDVLTFGEKTETSRRVTFFLSSEEKGGLPSSELKKVDFKLDGKKYAVAQVMHFHLEPDEYELEIDHPRYDPVYDATLVVKPDGKKPLGRVIKWKKAKACIKVSSDPGGAMLYIDGKKIKKTPLWSCYSVVPGRHKLKLRHPDYADYDTEIEVRKGGEPSLHYDLTRSSAFLNLRVSPAEADVYIDGKKLKKKAPFKKYEFGPDVVGSRKTHVFTVAKKGYEDAVFTLEMKFNGTYNKEVRLKKMPEYNDGVLKPDTEFVFIPPLSDKTNNALVNLLTPSISYNKSTKKMWAVVRIDPVKYKSFINKNKKKAKSTKTLPFQCSYGTKSACALDKDELGEKKDYSSSVYLRSDLFNYGFFSDSASFLKIPRMNDDFLPGKKNEKYFLHVNFGGECVESFRFSVNQWRHVSGWNLFDLALSYPGEKNAESDSLFFAVKKCRYIPPVRLKLSRDV